MVFTKVALIIQSTKFTRQKTRTSAPKRNTDTNPKSVARKKIGSTLDRCSPCEFMNECQCA